MDGWEDAVSWWAKEGQKFAAEGNMDMALAFMQQAALVPGADDDVVEQIRDGVAELTAAMNSLVFICEPQRQRSRNWRTRHLGGAIADATPRPMPVRFIT